MYPLHPFTVHFPIALLLANGLLTLLYLYRGRQRAFETSAYHCLALGWIGSLAAVLSGAWDAWQQVYAPDATMSTAVLNRVNLHAAAGVAIVLVYGRALLLRRRHPDVLDDPQQRRGYLRLLFAGVLLVLLAGWLGGQLVYTFRLGLPD
jgi:uncharacterized membrane protein